MVIFGREPDKVCSNCHPRPVIVERMLKLDVYQCPVCYSTKWHWSGEVPENESTAAEGEVTA